MTRDRQGNVCRETQAGGPASPTLTFDLRMSRCTEPLRGGGRSLSAVVALVLLVLARPAGADDRDALMDLYDATGGANWTKKAGWGGPADIGTWDGVTTDEDGNVTDLALTSNNLSGSIPAAVGNLTALSNLHLNNNNLSGSIPAAVGNLAALSNLDLSNNNLSGAIPAAVGNLTALVWLYLHNNTALSGPLPASFPSGLTNLRVLHIQDTRVTVPTEPAFAAWLVTLELSTGGTTPSASYLPLTEDTVPRGLWSDGTTLWAVNLQAVEVFAYSLATGTGVEQRDIALVAANAAPRGLWSDGTTLWVADAHDAKLYAYSRTTGNWEQARDCLLYTSPSPRDGLLSRMPSSA